MVIKVFARDWLNGLRVGWQIVKESAPVWLPGAVVVLGVMSLVGGPACVR